MSKFENINGGSLMIKAYLAFISLGYEGEDVEIQYSIYDGEELIKKQVSYIDYKKPALAGQFAVRMLLEELEDYKEEEIKIIIHDGALYEVLIGTSTSRDRELQEMGKETREEFERFRDLEIEDIEGDHLAIEEWRDKLKF